MVYPIRLPINDRRPRTNNVQRRWVQPNNTRRLSGAKSGKREKIFEELIRRRRNGNSEDKMEEGVYGGF